MAITQFLPYNQQAMLCKFLSTANYQVSVSAYLVFILMCILTCNGFEYFRAISGGPQFAIMCIWSTMSHMSERILFILLTFLLQNNIMVRGDNGWSRKGKKSYPTLGDLLFPHKLNALGGDNCTKHKLPLGCIWTYQNVQTTTWQITSCQ